MRSPSLSRCLFLLPLVAACGGGDTPSSVLSLVTGDETDAFTRTPAPTEVVVLKVEDGAEVARATLPRGDLALADVLNEELLNLRIEARDASGGPLLVGFAGPIQGSELSGRALPVLVSRTFEFARLPGDVTSRKNPQVAVVDRRYLAIADETSDTTDLYDLLSLAPLPRPPKLPRAPKTLVPTGTKLIVVSDSGASTFDLADSTTKSVSLPLDPSEILGARSAVGSNGVTLVVGNTTHASTKILRVAKDGTLSALDLAVPRLHPAITFVGGIGFIIVGGGDPAAATIEVLPEDGSATFPLSYVDVIGANVATNAIGSTLLLTDGASVRSFDLTCRTTCVSRTWAAALVPFRPQTILPHPGTDRATIVGTKDDGETVAVAIDNAVVTAVPFRVPHFGATYASFDGRHYFVGGATKVETIALPKLP